MSIDTSSATQHPKWEGGNTSFTEKNWDIILVVGSIALIAIGGLVAGGLMLQYSLPLNGWASAFGAGGGLLLVDLVVGGVLLYMRNAKKNDEAENAPSEELSHDNSSPPK